MQVECPHCKEKYDIEKEQLGMNATCSICNNTFILQDPANKSQRSKEKSKERRGPGFMEVLVPYIKFFIFLGIVGGGYYYLKTNGILGKMPWDKAPAEEQKAQAEEKKAPVEEKKAPDAVQNAAAENKDSADKNASAETAAPEESIDEAMIKRDIARGFVFSEDNRTLVKVPKDITSYIVPNGVIQIGDEAFLDCRDLEKVTISESVQKIGKLAFSNCFKLKSITIPANVTEIGESAFWGIESVVLAENHPAFMFGASGELINHKTKTLLSLPPGFNGRYTIPEDVVHIGNAAFLHCEKLLGIKIHNLVVSIGSRAFWGCGNLRSVTIPDTVVEIGDGAFYGATEVIVSKNHPVITVDASGALVDLKKKTLLYLPRDFKGHYKIPDNIVKIGDSAFSYCQGLLGVTIPDTVISIGERAFLKCSNLRSLIFPDNLSMIGSNAFEDCLDLRSVTIPAGVQKIASATFSGCRNLKSVTMTQGVTSIEERAFANCTELERVTLPVSITKIGDRAFELCTKLQRLVLPKDVVEIGTRAFYDCVSLRRVHIAHSEAKIGVEAFAGVRSVTICNNHQSVYRDDIGALIDKESGILFYFPRTFSGDYKVPAYATAEKKDRKSFNKDNNNDGAPSITIGRSAFYKCGNLRNIVIPSGVSKIEEEAFSGCENLLSVAIPEGITRIEKGTFRNCANLNSVSIPEGITKVGEEAFINCTNLTKIVIPEGCAQIGKSAFKNCGLQQVILSGSVAEIDEQAFESCKQLILITFPEGLSKIGDRAFAGCSTLSNLAIPGNVKEIGKGAFVEVSGIEVASGNTYFKVDAAGALIDLKRKALIYFPSAFEERYTVPKGVSVIESNAFFGCSLKGITLSNEIVQINNSAFIGCKSLEEILIPASVTGIGEMAFKEVPAVKVANGHPVFRVDGSGALIDIKNKKLLHLSTGFAGHYKVPADVEVIGSNAFSFCRDLSEITIPEGVVEIGSNAFKDCTNLKNVILPKSVRSVFANAFSNAGCELQVSVDYPHLFQ